VRRDTLCAAASVAMNQIFFGLKRAHHGVLRITRSALAKLGLTAARFDLMYVVHQRRDVTQREVRGELGVSAATVSRMLKSLETIGLLRRERADWDRRQRLVRLTEAGGRSIRSAIRHFIKWGAAQLMVDGALCPEGWYDDAACLTAMDALEGHLRNIREAYGDVAALYYPWDPDD
jgi:DNA-binding MarR family transcriptional regulator